MAEGKRRRVLVAAQAVLLRYGYKRVSMHDIAAAAGVSRPALYLLFKNKEEIFIGVYSAWLGETIAAVEAATAGSGTMAEKLGRAFEIWAVQPFEMAMGSPEARELMECAFGFAQESLTRGYAAFEAAIAPVLAVAAAGAGLAPERMAHVLAGAVRGFKQSAGSAEELRGLIEALLRLVLEV